MLRSETFMAFAKVNLFLRIVARRSDGFHEIETLFQKITLADRLTFQKKEGSGIEIDLPKTPMLGDLRISPADNLVGKAYDMLQKYAGTPLPGVKAVLEKGIPSGGGLGGGSSDGATALGALNQMCAVGADGDALREIALRLGSDVPFFLGPSTAVGRGRGEQLSPIRLGRSYWVALAFPKISVSTAAAYGRYRPCNRAMPPGSLDDLVGALQGGDLPKALSILHNEMEGLAFGLEPALSDIHANLENAAGQPVRMSGSGSTLFTLSNSPEGAEAIASRWQSLNLCRNTTARFILDG